MTRNHPVEERAPSGGAQPFAPQRFGAVLIRAADRQSDLGTVKDLFVEYGQSLNFSLCFQGFDEELATLPGKYAPPHGLILLAEAGGRAIGCVALRPLSEADICEMKRLYVRPDGRKLGLGRYLARTIVAEGDRLGYRAMRLDTLPMMQAAIALYGQLGFTETAPYCDNPIEGAMYLEKRYRRR